MTEKLNPMSLRRLTGAVNLTCFYHQGCPDGLGGAFAIYAHLPAAARRGIDDAGGVALKTSGSAALQALRRGGPVFQGIAPGYATPPAAPLVAGRDVVFVDVTPRADILAQVAAAARTVTVLDHHRSAEMTLASLASLTPQSHCAVVYDEDRSGAQIAWDWAAGTASARPAIIDYIGDRDLYRFALPDSRAISKAIHTEGVVASFDTLNAAVAAFDAAGLAERGEAYLRYEQGILAQMAATAVRMTLSAMPLGGGAPRAYRVLAVNAPTLQSELGESLMLTASDDIDFAVVWRYAHSPDEIWVSARTNRDDIDLSAITQSIVGALRGGGHPRAAGFTVAGGDVRTFMRAVC